MVVVIKRTDTKRTIQKKIKSVKPLKSKKLFDAYKYLGTVKISGNPNDIQKKMRDEWECAQ